MKYSRNYKRKRKSNWYIK